MMTGQYGNCTDPWIVEDPLLVRGTIRKTKTIGRGTSAESLLADDSHKACPGCRSYHRQQCSVREVAGTQDAHLYDRDGWCAGGIISRHPQENLTAQVGCARIGQNHTQEMLVRLA